jgi:hypothetical protein
MSGHFLTKSNGLTAKFYRENGGTPAPILERGCLNVEVFRFQDGSLCEGSSGSHTVHTQYPWSQSKSRVEMPFLQLASTYTGCGAYKHRPCTRRRVQDSNL